MSRNALAFVSLLFVSAIARGQDAVQLAPRPDWVDVLPLENRARDGALRGTVDYLLLDYQDDVRGEVLESYVHVAKRVLNEQGVQYESEISIDFDPTYQETIWPTRSRIRRQ